MKGGHSIKILGNNGNYDNKMPSMNCFANKIKGNGGRRISVRPHPCVFIICRLTRITVTGRVLTLPRGAFSPFPITAPIEK